ncbi:hypothetical protein NE237_007413 [Protea cynaroides]|uniref:Kinesin motor domain-containing protein n=1 Tax=Protea cynaroides TaxID=273540 RepID=A0A9Q0KPG0_9MAGN|nr:hypothetical protein NE237_007413 [Protea cynaroides]
MQPVKSTGDVLRLMRIGLTNRAVGSTAMNERSSRSHSVLTVHVRGTDLATGAIFRGNLHLVDLAGSERVDRSEVVGDRLREAQHINKSLSALGDVIFALAQKSPHVPYRNSKLTQVLQSSLGGQAKTLMFVQLNPDADSYSESLSTLKFAERVSGIELGAARSNKEGKDVRELMEQVASLKDTIAKKDEEIERLQLLKDHRPVSPAANDAGQNSSADLELLGSGDADSEDRLSDISDGGLSMGTETDGSISSAVESTLFPEGAKPDEGIEKSKPSPSKLSKPAQKQVQTGSIRRSSSKETLKVSTSSKNISTSGSSSAAKLIKKFQQT